ncbi:MAG: 2-C-methyl-D-erythritol 2,4-cyclodiphosphate synthase [Solirubrobacterales bacterium]
MTHRIGHGYDSHRLVEGRPLILGGVRIPHDRGLEGHSDADVVAHAVTDAVLGAVGRGDIGELFPDDDPRWRDADSLELLRVALAGGPGRVVNADVTIVCEAPRLGPHRRAMAANLEEVLGAPVNVKATTNERMGPVGRGEGIAAFAVALLTI